MSVIYFIFQQTMLFTIPLMIVALGGMFSERSGVVNIALEGIMTMGAFTGILFLNMTGGRMSGQMQLLLAILISTATGAVFAFFHAYASINMKANQTISGTALTCLPAFASLWPGSSREYSRFSLTIPSGLNPFPCWAVSRFSGLCYSRTIHHHVSGRRHSDFVHPGALPDQVRPEAALLRRASPGSRRSGHQCLPHAVRRRPHIRSPGRFRGAVFVVPTSTNFNADVAGYGFLALAVLIFGQWKPVKIMWASLFFGLMKAVAAAYSGIPFLAATGIPSYVYKMIPYVATLIVLVFTSRNSQAPRASGVPYDKGQR